MDRDGRSIWVVDGHRGATTTRRVPLDGRFGPPTHCFTPPIDCERAFDNTVKGVLIQGFPNITLPIASDSCVEAECATTVTPDGCASTDIGVGNSVLLAGIGRGASTCHFASCKSLQICWATSKHSGSSLKYMIATWALGWPAISLKKPRAEFASALLVA